MKRVYVLTIKSGVEPSLDAARGSIEDVETGEEFVFCSVSALLNWLQQTTTVGYASLADRALNAGESE